MLKNLCTLTTIILILTGCAYRMGSGQRSIPGGYSKLAIPIFKNASMEPGIEVAFTNALIQEFQRASFAKITAERDSEVKVVGEVSEVTYQPSSKRTAGDSSSPYLPEGTVLASEYRIVVSVNVSVLRATDGVSLWQGTFRGERTYVAPQVTLEGVNSVNPLYNLSARRQNIESMSIDMMAEAFDRITENF